MTAGTLISARFDWYAGLVSRADKNGEIIMGILDILSDVLDSELSGKVIEQSTNLNN